MAEHVIENSNLNSFLEENNKSETIQKIDILGNKIEKLMNLNENDLKDETNIELLLNSVRLIYHELFLIKNELEKENNKNNN